MLKPQAVVVANCAYSTPARSRRQFAKALALPLLLKQRPALGVAAGQVFFVESGWWVKASCNGGYRCAQICATSFVVRMATVIAVKQLQRAYSSQSATFRSACQVVNQQFRRAPCEGRVLERQCAGEQAQSPTRFPL